MMCHVMSRVCDITDDCATPILQLKYLTITRASVLPIYIVLLSQPDNSWPRNEKNKENQKK